MQTLISVPNTEKEMHRLQRVFLLKEILYVLNFFFYMGIHLILGLLKKCVHVKNNDSQKCLI